MNFWLYFKWNLFFDLSTILWFLYFWPTIFNDISLRMDLPLSLFFTWLLKSMYVVCSTWNQFSTFVWHSWCRNMLTYLAYFTVRPRNHMAGALEYWHWPLTTRSCQPGGICVRAGLIMMWLRNIVVLIWLWILETSLEQNLLINM